MARKGKRRRRGYAPGVRRLEAILRRLALRADHSFDHRPAAGQPPPRSLTLKGNRELFDRLAVLDFEYLLSLPFAADAGVLRLLLPQSVFGRAQNGHGWFVDEAGRPLCFPDATFDRVLTALERSHPDLPSHRVRQRRGELLEGLVGWILGNLETERIVLSVQDGPPLGIQFLAGRKVAAGPFLKGMALAGSMDDWDQRQMAVSYFGTTFGGEPLRIGGGEIHIVDRQKLQAVGLTDPGRSEFTDREIRHLRDLGVVVAIPDPGERPCFPQYDQAFFRRRLGGGISDDLAFIYIGARYGFDAMLGAFLMDAIDTWDKHLWRLVPGGSDAALAVAIQERHRRLHGRPAADGQEILEVIRFAAKENWPPCFLSSSHRRLIQREKGTRVPTLLHHWRFVGGEPLDDLKLGYNRVPAREFYAIAHRRLEAVGLQVPPPVFKERR